MRLTSNRLVKIARLSSSNVGWNNGNYYYFRNTFHSSSYQCFWKVPNDLKTNLQSAVENARSTIFDLMVKNMSAKEVNKFLSHWKDQLQESEHQPAANISQTKDKLESSPPIESNKSQIKEEILAPTYQSQKDIELYHPLLGELIVDHGYKRIYATSVNALANTPVWKKQRILRPERATLIAEDKIRRGITSQLPGIITLYQDERTKEVGIIDGQHRVGALMILAQRGYWNAREKNILTEVFSTTSEEDIAVLFRIINAAEPVRLIDMPDQLGISDTENEEDDEEEEEKETNTKPALTQTTTSLPEKASEVGDSMTKKNHGNEAVSKSLSTKKINQILTDGLEELRNQYPEMFKPTSRCKIPHVNIDVLRDDLYTSDFLRIHQLSDVSQLKAHLKAINDDLQIQYEKLLQDEQKFMDTYPKSFQTALKKAKKYQFYLGMDKQWIYTTPSPK